MKKIYFIVLILTTTQAFSQVNDDLVQLAKYYRQFILRNTLTETALEDLNRISQTELKFTSEFIKETLTDNNKLISDKFLQRPANKDLRYIYIVQLINYNISKETPIDNNELINELLTKNISDYELIHTYYQMFFVGYGNKVKPYGMSNINFQINKYGLKDDTEKGIFFLESMQFNGTLIWGYINIVKPPNYEKALNYISQFPKYNGSSYYQYLDFGFPDFEINIESETQKQSYKQYYMNKFYDTLISHLMCLNNSDKEKVYDLVLGSILKERSYYKYSKKQTELNKLLSVYQKN